MNILYHYIVLAGLRFSDNLLCWNSEVSLQRIENRLLVMKTGFLVMKTKFNRRITNEIQKIIMNKINKLIVQIKL